MGQLVNGEWTITPVTGDRSDGRFVRKDATFRSWITADGAPGPSGEGGFSAEPGRYHLYVSYACPWAHRTLIMRALKGLESAISVSVTHWFMGDRGWSFDPGEGTEADPINNARYVHQLYQRAEPQMNGRATVPVLWDRQTGKIVSNESSEIIRMFNSAFDASGAAPGDYYPEPLRAEIDDVNARVYDTLNNGVYKSGFARNQAAYEAAVLPLFETMDWLESRLDTQRYLVGDQLTEADIRLFTTLVRFDSVYVGHFKCNIRRLIDYPALWAYTRDIFQTPGVEATVNLQHIKQHYYQSHETVNPTRVVPVGPKIDFHAPHGRGALR